MQFTRNLFLTLFLCLFLLGGVVVEDSKSQTTDVDGDLKAFFEGTELMRAAAAGNMDTVTALVKKGADINEKAGFGSQTALIKAADNGHADIVLLLIENSADVNLEDDGGMSAMMYAAEKGHRDIVQTLLEKGARVNKSNTTPLMCAAKKGHKDIVLLLIEKGADINAVCAGSGTALMNAAGNGHTDIVQILLKKGADTNVNVGGTALMFAAREGKADIVRALLEKGADINATDSVGYTALSLAEARGQTDVVAILKAASGEKIASEEKNPQKNIQESLSTADMEILNQLQPSATEREKKLYREAKGKNETFKFLATRKYMRLLNAQFGNKDLNNEDLEKAPSCADPNIDMHYTTNIEEQMKLYNIQLYQGIDKE